MDVIAESFRRAWAEHSEPRSCLYWDAYLVGSLCYYHFDSSPFTDAEFDKVCAWLLANAELVRSKAWNVDLLDEDLLRAGTGFSIPREAYPARIFAIALSYTEAP